MKYYSLILSFLSVFLFEGLVAQPLVDDSQTYGVLVFEHLDKSKTQLIRVGGWVKYRLYSNPRMLMKGTLQKVTKNSMIIDGREIALSDCQMIAGRVRSDKEILGSVFLGMGVAIVPFAAGITSLLPTAGAIAIIGGGVVLMSSGIVMLMRKKRFRMDKGWSVYGGTLDYSRTHQ
jgi:hypothetical protein